MISWIQAWLTDRIQREIVEGEISNWKPVLVDSTGTNIMFDIYK